METALSGPAEATQSACFLLYSMLLFEMSLFLIQDAIGRVSFMTDIWSDQHLQPFLAITAHWIAKVDGATSALQFKKVLIAFHRVCGRHDAKLLAVTTLGLFDRANVTVKVG